MGSKRRKRKKRMGRLALGIGCMLVSAGAFAAVIYFSQAGQKEVEKEPVSQQTSDEKDKNNGQAVSKDTKDTEIDQKLEELTLQEKIAQMKAEGII